jgi:glycyl-tRNA synthetase beta chain
MGRYYALEAGEKAAVADAARDHYSPLGPSDDVPSEPVSVAVALADKIDTLTGFWAIDEKPTGSKDPFALRRAALGVIRLVLGNGVRINLFGLLVKQCEYWDNLENARIFLADQQRLASLAESHGMPPEALRRALRDHGAGSGEDSPERDAFWKNMELRVSVFSGMQTGDQLRAALVRNTNLLSFFHDRLKVFLKDQGIRHDVIDACLAMPGNDDLTLLVKRATALAETLKTEDGANLIQGFKRINNILVQDQQRNPTLSYEYGADTVYFEAEEEHLLFAALDRAEAAIAPAMAAEDFPAAMAAMAALRAPIDAFFTAVQVNADNPVVRRNRLNLLHRIRAVCSGVADLTRIEG